MNLKELEIKYKEMGEEIEKLKSNKKDKWIPEHDEKYYFLALDRSIDSYINNDEFDGNLMKYNKVFKTHEEVTAYRNYLNARDEYSYEFSNREWEHECIDKYYIYYSYYSEKLITDSEVSYRDMTKIYFKTQEQAQEFIDKYEKEILLYEFGIEV